MSQESERICYQVVLFHGIACYFFLNGMANLMLVPYISDVDRILGNRNTDLSVADEIFLEMRIQLYPVITNIIGFFISLYHCKKQKWSVLNSLTMLILVYLFVMMSRKLHLPLPWQLYVAHFSGDLLIDIVVAGSIMLLIGLYLFFSQFTNNFVQNSISAANLQHGKKIL